MFDNQRFEDWLNAEATKAMDKITRGEAATPNEMMMLVLKAQTNHIAHMEVDLRGEMITLRKDMDKRFEQAKLENQQRFEQVDKRFEQVDKRFEQAKLENQQRFDQVDKRFEQVDRRFEQVDRRFDALIARIDRFMVWSFSTTLIVGGLVVAAIRYFVTG